MYLRILFEASRLKKHDSWLWLRKKNRCSQVRKVIIYQGTKGLFCHTRHLLFFVMFHTSWDGGCGNWWQVIEWNSSCIYKQGGLGSFDPSDQITWRYRENYKRMEALIVQHWWRHLLPRKVFKATKFLTWVIKKTLWRWSRLQFWNAY